MIIAAMKRISEHAIDVKQDKPNPLTIFLTKSNEPPFSRARYTRFANPSMPPFDRSTDGPREKKGKNTRRTRGGGRRRWNADRKSPGAKLFSNVP